MVDLALSTSSLSMLVPITSTSKLHRLTGQQERQTAQMVNLDSFPSFREVMDLSNSRLSLAFAVSALSMATMTLRTGPSAVSLI